MTLKKLLLSIAGGLGILGAFLPWYRASLLGFSMTANAFGLDSALYVILAILAIVCAAAIIVLNVFKEKQISKIIKIKDLNKNLSKILLGAGVALLVIAIITFIALQNDSKGFGNVSWGIWLIGLAGVIVIVLPLLKNVAILDKVVIGQTNQGSKEEAKKEEVKKDTKKETKKSSK